MSRQSSVASALCLMTAGALSLAPPMRINATGVVIRSLGGTGQSEVTGDSCCTIKSGFENTGIALKWLM